MELANVKVLQLTVLNTDGAVHRRSVEWLFKQISQYLRENTCLTMAPLMLATCEFYEIVTGRFL